MKRRPRLDMPRRLKDDAASHKVAHSRSPAFQADALAVNATIPSTLEFPFSAPPCGGATKEVAPGVLWLRMPLPFALDHIHHWLLADGEGWTQVDTGYGDGPTRALWNSHFATTLGAHPITRVIATHYHPDHLGNAAWLCQRFGCTVAMPQAEYLTAHAIAEEHSGFGVAAIAALFRAHGMIADHVAALERRGNQYRRGVPELPFSFLRLQAHDEISIGANRWQVIPGHGHSPEHASLHCQSMTSAFPATCYCPESAPMSASGRSSPTAIRWRAFSIRLRPSPAYRRIRSSFLRTVCRLSAPVPGSSDCARTMTRGWPS